MRMGRVFKIRDRYANRIHDIMTRTDHFMASHEWMLDQLKTDIWCQNDYKSLPRWAKSYLDGINHTLFYLHYDHKTECRWRVRGTTKPLLYADDIGQDKAYRWQDVELAGRYYRGTGIKFS